LAICQSGSRRSFELIVNRNSATALGIDLPEAILLRADFHGQLAGRRKLADC